MKHYTPHHVVCVCVSQILQASRHKKKKKKIHLTTLYFKYISPLVRHALLDSSIGSLGDAAICAISSLKWHGYLKHKSSN